MHVLVSGRREYELTHEDKKQETDGESVTPSRRNEVSESHRRPFFEKWPVPHPSYRLSGDIPERWPT